MAINEDVPWLMRLRAVVAAAAPHNDPHGTSDVSVDLNDLREAIGAAAPGPGSVAYIGYGAMEGHITIDYRTLLRWVHLTPAQATHFAETILKQVHEAPQVAESRRLSAASQN